MSGSQKGGAYARALARELPLEQLYAGYYETVLQKNELITSVTVPALGARKADRFAGDLG